jgi:hypothetical protein
MHFVHAIIIRHLNKFRPALTLFDVFELSNARDHGIPKLVRPPHALGIGPQWQRLAIALHKPSHSHQINEKRHKKVRSKEGKRKQNQLKGEDERIDSREQMDGMYKSEGEFACVVLTPPASDAHPHGSTVTQTCCQILGYRRCCNLG